MVVPNAAEIARKEAERIQRRTDLQNEIDRLNAIVSDLNDRILELQADQKKLNICLSDWTRQKNIYNNSVVLSSVVIVNVFEGVCAEKIKDDLTACISQMDHTYSDVTGLSTNISEQVSRLRQNIFTIKKRLTALYSELNSI